MEQRTDATGTPVAESTRPRGDDLQSGEQKTNLSLSEAASVLAQRRQALRQESSEGSTEPRAEATPDAEAPEQPVQDSTPDDDGELDAGEVEEGSEESVQEAGEDPDAQPEDGNAALLELVDDDQKVVLDGEEITVASLREGRMRQEDYTRKTQELAQQRSESERLTKQYATRLGQLDQEMRKDLAQFEGVDWMALSQQNPQQYMAARAQYDAAQLRHQQLTKQTESFFGELESVQKRQKAQAGQAAVKELKRKIKGWNNARYYDLVDYAEKQGFPRQTALDWTDPHIFVMLNKAKAFDAAQKVGTKKVVKSSATRNVRANAPVSRKPAAEQTDVTAAKTKLEHSGKIDDAVALLKARRQQR